MADDTASLSLRLSLSMTGDPQMSSEVETVSIYQYCIKSAFVGC